jgi:hypothetical protein
MRAHPFTLQPRGIAKSSADVSALFEAQQVLADAVLLGALFSARTPQRRPDDVVETAAKHVFDRIHEALERVGEGTVLSRVDRRDVWEGLEQAWLAIKETRIRSAKALQLEVTDGRPLTVCFGRGARRVNGRIHFATYGDGCGRVFADSLVRFSRYCPKCQAKPGGRFKKEAIARAQAGAEGRHRITRYDPEANPVEVWRVLCRSCGEGFDTLEPCRRRCDRCHRGHRSPRT